MPSGTPNQPREGTHYGSAPPTNRKRHRLPRNTMDELITVAHAARLTGRTPRVIRHYLKTGVIASTPRYPGSARVEWLVRKGDLTEVTIQPKHGVTRDPWLVAIAKAHAADRKTRLARTQSELST